jgi:hypothetical protein
LLRYKNWLERSSPAKVARNRPKLIGRCGALLSPFRLVSVRCIWRQPFVPMFTLRSRLRRKGLGHLAGWACPSGGSDDGSAFRSFEQEWRVLASKIAPNAVFSHLSRRLSCLYLSRGESK